MKLIDLLDRSSCFVERKSVRFAFRLNIIEFYREAKNSCSFKNIFFLIIGFIIDSYQALGLYKPQCYCRYWGSHFLAITNESMRLTSDPVEECQTAANEKNDR